jgi:hypothetical protein
VIGIFPQYAYLGSGKTIHSAAQLEHYQNDVNDRSIKVSGGLQRILTLDGYVIPINIVAGLPYISMRPYTDDEWDLLPHVILTSDLDWDPTVLDHTLDDDEHWYDAMCDLDAPSYDSPTLMTSLLAVSTLPIRIPLSILRTPRKPLLPPHRPVRSPSPTLTMMRCVPTLVGCPSTR